MMFFLGKNEPIPGLVLKDRLWEKMHGVVILAPCQYNTHHNDTQHNNTQYNNTRIVSQFSHYAKGYFAECCSTTCCLLLSALNKLARFSYDVFSWKE